MIPKYWQQAITELSEKDPIMAKIISRYQGEMLQSRGDAFGSLARSIVGQQISVKAAASVWNKMENNLGAIKKDIIFAASDEDLRSCGLSRQKVSYMKNLAGHFIDKSINPATFHVKSDEEIIKELTLIKGIGRWTAEMFLIFHMLRPNIFPLDDIGLQKAIAKHYGRRKPHVLGRTWQPWCSVATWYLWRSLDPLPVEY